MYHQINLYIKIFIEKFIIATIDILDESPNIEDFYTHKELMNAKKRWDKNY